MLICKIVCVFFFFMCILKSVLLSSVLSLAVQAVYFAINNATMSGTLVVCTLHLCMATSSATH